MSSFPSLRDSSRAVLRRRVLRVAVYTLAGISVWGVAVATGVGVNVSNGRTWAIAMVPDGIHLVWGDARPAPPGDTGEPFPYWHGIHVRWVEREMPLWWFSHWTGFHLQGILTPTWPFFFPLLLWWAVRRARRKCPRGPGFCGACGYDLTGAVTGVCPECGIPTAPSQTDASAEAQAQGTKEAQNGTSDIDISARRLPSDVWSDADG